MVVGSGLYLILTNTRKKEQKIDLSAQEKPPQTIELTETSPKQPPKSTPDADELEPEEELEKLNK